MKSNYFKAYMEQQIHVLDDAIEIKSSGKVFLTIINKNGTASQMAVRNKVVLSGRSALASVVANDFEGPFSFYIARVLFGNSGTVSGTPRFVEDTQTGLFGPVILAKPVIATIDPLATSQVTFTTTVTFGELIGFAINEMALEMANGDLFSMTTFGDVNKTSTMQLIWNWRLNWI